MSLAGPSGTPTDGVNEYDHAIVLIDATKHKNDLDESSDEENVPLSKAGSGAPLGRRWTKNTLREELTRRKYAKWQEDRTENNEEVTATGRQGTDAVEEEGPGPKKAKNKSPDRAARLRKRLTFKAKNRGLKAGPDEGSYVDILYENQRGWFLFGIPLYSDRSLLPADPSPWQTSTFKDSPVNITNAQVPDPSWAWVWKTWYVDMSYDVDEEGWQYSFSFHTRFAWHGTHPWFHSFVRRRRWLRKRVKIHPLKPRGDNGNLKQAHLLNEDYFTIHRVHDRSRGSSVDKTINKRSSYLGSSGNNSDSEDEIGDITDIPKLMRSLKKARVDREKILAVQAFVDQGGADLVYLAENMVDVMNFFIYQTSRQQLQSYLLRALDKVKEEIQNEDTKAEDDKLKKKSSHLVNAVHAADLHINNVNPSASEEEKNNQADEVVHGFGPGIGPSSLSKDKYNGRIKDEENMNVADEMKGIPEDAEISKEPDLEWDATQEKDSTRGASNKGK